MRTRRMSKEQGKRCNISRFPNFHKSGSISGMKRIYYGMDALLVRWLRLRPSRLGIAQENLGLSSRCFVRCGDYIYNVSSEPNIYHQASY
ncbi:MAG: hypothetical protein ACI4B3_10535 [Prevotella sp.]